MSTITIQKALFYVEKELNNKNIDSALLDAQLLLSFVLKKPYEFILTNPEYLILNIQYLKFKSLINKRKQGYSVAALTGHKEFYGIDFYVNKDVLIPRPETEILVETILDLTRRGDPCGRPFNRTGASPAPTNPNILEIGTGSGCISLTLAKHLPSANIVALDISNKALRVAKKNQRLLKIKGIKFKRSDLLSEFKNPEYRRWVFEPDIIIANLPYLAEKEMKEPSISKEPKKALYGGKDGLELYEKLLKQIAKKFKFQSSKSKAQKNILILFEINPSQSKKITEMIKNIFPESKIEVKKDLAGKDRIVKIEI